MELMPLVRRELGQLVFAALVLVVVAWGSPPLWRSTASVVQGVACLTAVALASLVFVEHMRWERGLPLMAERVFTFRWAGAALVAILVPFVVVDVLRETAFPDEGMLITFGVIGGFAVGAAMASIVTVGRCALNPSEQHSDKDSRQ
jgi:hypothetical protein